MSRERIPDGLADKPVLEVRPLTEQPSPDLIDSRAALTAFGQAWRDACGKSADRAQRECGRPGRGAEYGVGVTVCP